MLQYLAAVVSHKKDGGAIALKFLEVFEALPLEEFIPHG